MTLKRKFKKVAQHWGKTILIAFVAIFIAGAVNAQRNSPKKIGVLINGIVWSPYNVGATGKFVANPEGFGLYYQWNRKDTTDFVLCADYKPCYSPTTWLPSNREWGIA